MTSPKRLLASLALTATALGTLTLTACGAQDTGGGQRAAKPAVTPAGASASPRMLSGKDLEKHPDPTVRAQAIALRITNTCAPGTAIELPPLPAVSNVAELDPGAGPEPSGPPVPVELPSDVPPPPGPEATASYDELPLNDVDRCAAKAHADRVRSAFDGPAPTDEAALRTALVGADYLPESVHRMPGDGPVRLRIDLRDLSPNDNLVLEVTPTPTGVRVDPFGAPIAGDPDVTKIVHKGA
ncbi:hypothetical protein AB0E83_15960 [Streptomyces sp. NPDC035033]|uniref:hypothetical protein n=1 Tax=Streptomyces sp. NPDC035033 TaxID=3155368 RepID=UPI00340CDAF1